FNMAKRPGVLASMVNMFSNRSKFVRSLFCKESFFPSGFLRREIFWLLTDAKEKDVIPSKQTTAVIFILSQHLFKFRQKIFRGLLCFWFVLFFSFHFCCCLFCI